MTFLPLFLEEQVAQASGFSSIFMLVLLVVFFVVMIVLPEKKRKKKENDLFQSLSLGDELITIGGLMGKIVQITDETVTFETGEDRVRIQIRKDAIRTTTRFEAAQAAPKKK